LPITGATVGPRRGDRQYWMPAFAFRGHDEANP
jgi:hypothetical protein